MLPQSCYFPYCDNISASLFEGITMPWKCFKSISLSLSKREKHMTTDHRLETTWLTNLFTNQSCAGAEKDILQQDAATAVETETVTGSRATRKCSKCKA